MTTKELVKELISDAELLVQRQVGLARLEAKQQIREELRTAGFLSVGGALGYAAAILLLTAGTLAIGAALGRLWLGPLLVGGALLLLAAIAGAVGWTLRVRQPLPRTASEVKKELEWSKHRT